MKAPFSFARSVHMLGIVVISYLFAVNALTLLAFRTDKKRAISGDWRIPENTLLMLSLFGGWPAAKIAQRRYRHKTRKQPFAFLLNAVPLVWTGALFVLIALVSLPDLQQHLVDAFASETHSTHQRTTPKFFDRISH